MPYSDAQLMMYNTKPANRPYYNTIELYNVHIGYQRLVQSGPNGPYKPIMLLDHEGVAREFKPVAASIPDTSIQDPSSNVLCVIKLGRVASQAIHWLNVIARDAKNPDEKVITCRVSLYQGLMTSPISSRLVYVGEDAITINESDVNITLEMENPAKIAFGPYYDPAIWDGLING